MIFICLIYGHLQYHFRMEEVFTNWPDLVVLAGDFSVEPIVRTMRLISVQCIHANKLPSVFIALLHILSCIFYGVPMNCLNIKVLVLKSWVAKPEGLWWLVCVDIVKNLCSRFHVSNNAGFIYVKPLSPQIHWLKGNNIFWDFSS